MGVEIDMTRYWNGVIRICFFSFLAFIFFLYIDNHLPLEFLIQMELHEKLNRLIINIHLLVPNRLKMSEKIIFNLVLTTE